MVRLMDGDERAMGCIAVDDLSQGMVLSQDVRDVHCRLLLSKGQKICDNHLRILKIWGVCQVHVVGGHKEEDDPVLLPDPDRYAKVQATVEALFKNLDTRHETIHVLYHAALAHRCEQTGAHENVHRPRLAHSVRAWGGTEEIRRRIARENLQLPDAPTIISELNTVIADPFATSNDVAQVVNKSPSLASHLLKIVNSAYYGFPSKIDRISRAVTIIGTKEISNLALGISVMRAFEDISPDLIDMSSFIRHSLACALLSRIIAAQKNISETEQVSVSGLLHDIGKLIVLKYYPGAALAAFEHAIACGGSVFQSEKEVLGIYHTRVAQDLLKKWNIPPMLENSIAFHHRPSAAVDPSKAVIVQMADIITNALGLGSSGEQCIPAFDDKAWDKLAIPACNMSLIIRQALHQLESIDFAME
jgi:HD-like signal output (HDOD) protein